MKSKAFLMWAFFTFMLVIPAYAGTVSVDLSSATTGTSIAGGGASFATAFVGQTYDGASHLSGSPSSPLTLNGIQTLDVESFNPGVSPTSNSILPEPGNQGPLSILLGSTADSITWTMGSASPPSTVTIDFFSDSGSVVDEVVQNLLSGYNVYSFSGFGTFKGLSIYDNNDAAGLRFQNISYNSIVATPEPSSLLLIIAGLAGIAAYTRGRSKS
jgi:hypothetical protein